MSNLKQQVEFNDSFQTWFDSEIKPTITDNRRRYAMKHKDAEKREKLGLSAVPSTKSTSTVDRAVERAIMEYHGEQDAISFTAKNAGDKQLDFLAAIHTENFHIRANQKFAFPVWNATSLTAGLVDGIEAGIVSWKNESYNETKTVYFSIGNDGQRQKIDEETYNLYSELAPEFFFEEEIEEKVVVTDTWWIDQLLPGENLIWDVKAPLLDINMGQACLVKVERTVDQILQMAENGVIDEIKKEDLKAFQDTTSNDTADASGTTDPDMGEMNTVELWIYFQKENSQWKVSFSLEGKKKLSEEKNLNEVWYNGRRVNRLPVIMGTTKLKPFLAIGRGIPETIRPVEDEYESVRNILLDAARQDVEGRWRLDEDSDVDINKLINSPVVFAKAGEVEKFDNRANSISALQQSGMLTGDINELAPVGMESSQMVPSGTDKTLGAVQMALGSSNEKLSVALMVRNFTFFRPLIYLISEMTIAFENDQNILKIAESRAGKKRQFQQQGQPMQMPVNGGGIDFNALDIPLNVEINAGLGSVPRQQKLQYMKYLVEVGMQLGINIDKEEVFRQGEVLLGFSEGQFISTEQITPTGPELKGTVNIDFDRLPPELQQQVLQTFARQSEEIKTSFKGTGDIKTPQLPPAAAQDPTGRVNGITG